MSSLSEKDHSQDSEARDGGYADFMGDLLRAFLSVVEKGLTGSIPLLRRYRLYKIQLDRMDICLRIVQRLGSWLC
jgi:hypothetical protein